MLDRNPDVFQHVLDYLRAGGVGDVQNLPDSLRDRERILAEFDCMFGSWNGCLCGCGRLLSLKDQKNGLLYFLLPPERKWPVCESPRCAISEVPCDGRALFEGAYGTLSRVRTIRSNSSGFCREEYNEHDAFFSLAHASPMRKLCFTCLRRFLHSAAGQRHPGLLAHILAPARGREAPDDHTVGTHGKPLITHRDQPNLGKQTLRLAAKPFLRD